MRGARGAASPSKGEITAPLLRVRERKVNNMRLPVIITLAVLPLATQAADKRCNAYALGDTSEMTCAQWFEARRSNQEAVDRAVEWAGGFMTARNLYGPGAGQQLPPETFAVLIDEHCKKLRYVQDAVFTIAAKLTGPLQPLCAEPRYSR